MVYTSDTADFTTANRWPNITYTPQWAAKRKALGVLRHNSYNAEGNLYFAELDTVTTVDNMLHVCELELLEVEVALNIVHTNETDCLL